MNKIKDISHHAKFQSKTGIGAKEKAAQRIT
jgi:hypothetical protein